jgi:serine phosphatase RsbU (regulator of sigma subunit)
MRTSAADGGPELTDAGAAEVIARLPVSGVRAAWDASPALIAVTIGAGHALAYQNPASRRVFGGRPFGIPMAEAFPEMPEGASEPLDRAFATGTTVETPPHPVSVRDLRGGEVVLGYVVTPWGEPTAGLVITAMDVTAQVRAETKAAQSHLLADITSRMTAAPDAGGALQALTDGLVPVVADMVAVYVVRDQRPGDDAPPPPEVITLSEALAAVGPPPSPSQQSNPSPWAAVLRSGTPVLVPVDESTLPVLAREPESARWLAGVEAQGLALVPLVVAGTLTGVMLLLAAGDRVAFRDEDLPFLEDVAARAGSAIAQARTLRSQREAASELQRALLPGAPPVIPGLTSAARYVAGAPDVEVGGDWWDVTDLGAGRVGLGIGDVSGRGVPAAAVMGQARAVMRAGGHARLGPAEVLDLIDRQLADVLAVPDRSPGASGGPIAPVRFATACYAVLDLAQRKLRVANAGHLPILLRSATGQVRPVHAPPGAPLGLGIGGGLEVAEAVADDDTLVLFTDGLVESRVLDIDDGLAMLSDAFASCGGHDDLEVVADALLDAMERRQGHGDDDVALLVVRVDPTAG